MSSLRKLPDTCPSCHGPSTKFVQWDSGKWKCGHCHAPISFLSPEEVVKVKPEAPQTLKTAKEILERMPIIDDPAISEALRDLEVGPRGKHIQEGPRTALEKPEEETGGAPDPALEGLQARLQEAFKDVKRGHITELLDKHKDDILKCVSFLGCAPTDKLLGLGHNTIDSWIRRRHIDAPTPFKRRPKVTPSSTKVDPGGQKSPSAPSALIHWQAYSEEPAPASIKKLIELMNKEVVEFRGGFEERVASYYKEPEPGARIDAYMEVNFEYMDDLIGRLEYWIEQLGDKDMLSLGLVALREVLRAIEAMNPEEPPGKEV